MELYGNSNFGFVFLPFFFRTVSRDEIYFWNEGMEAKIVFSPDRVKKMMDVFDSFREGVCKRLVGD